MTTTLTVSAAVMKSCPYHEEADEGTATLTFDVGEVDGPELHDLAAKLTDWEKDRISHEDFTRALLAKFGAVEVVTRWQTAGLDVECRAVR